MEPRTEDLLTAIGRCRSEASLREQILKAARALGFDRFAYGLRAPLPVTDPQIQMINNYPQGWRRRYAEAGYLAVDPTVRHGRRSQEPMVWSDALVAQAPEFWEEAHAFGLQVGWAQSCIDGRGAAGMLTLSRSGEPLSARELHAKEAQLRWLASASHVAFSRILAPRREALTPLTARELEVLKWLADGKTSRDTAAILGIAIDTVNFHVKNATHKLGAANKTAAAVRAALLGLWD